MRPRKIILFCSYFVLHIFILCLNTGCASGVKRQLASTQRDLASEKSTRRQLEIQRDQLEKQFLEKQKLLGDASAQIKFLTEQIDRSQQRSADDLRSERSISQNCTDDLHICESRRAYLESTPTGTLDALWNQCKADLKPTFINGFERGRLALLEALQLSGTTREACDWTGLFCKHFYKFELKIGSRSFVLTEIETASGQSPLLTTLGTVSDIIGAAALILPGPP